MRWASVSGVSTDRGGNGIGDVGEMVKAYARQELVGPLRNVGRFVGFGVAGALLLGLGLMLLALGGLRAIQAEAADTFDGNWSFVPYVIMLVAIGVAMALIGMRIMKGIDDDRR